MSTVRRFLLSLALCAPVIALSTQIAPPATSAGAATSSLHHVSKTVAKTVSKTVSNKSAPTPGDAEGEHDGHYCDGCTPPLVYSGGPVMDTTGATGVTITPIYWIPDGAAPFPEDYQTIINGYIDNVAADSGTDSNVYSINSEYSQQDGGRTTNIVYKITAGTPIVDTSPFPANGCNMLTTYTNCLTDDQARAELTRVTSAQGVTTDLANFFPIFFPPGVLTQDLDGSNSDSSFCGYHRAFGSGSSQIVYGVEPFEATGCDAGQGPNGDVVADGAVGTLSHEINEALTDPTDAAAWNDSTGHEIGDICANDFGQALGSTDPANPSTTEYNQVINGANYYTQTEFSNLAFGTFGIGKGCIQNEAAAGATPTPSHDVSAVGTVFTFAYPNALDADGTSTADISTSVSDLDNNIIEGDTVNFSVYAVTGTGQCGTLSADSAISGTDGYANITYTASKDDVVCAVVATDTQGGQASTGTVYQGADQVQAPSAADSFPTSLVPGADPVTFTTSFTNPGTDPIVNAQIDFSIFPGDKTTTDVTSDQVTLAYSTNGIDGPFTPVTLRGATVGDGGIDGTLGDPGGTTVDAGSTLIVTYQVSLDAAVPGDDAAPLLSFEAYLDQINPASGAGTNLADTAATDINVSSSGTVTTDTAVIDTSTASSGAADTAVIDTAVSDTTDNSTVVTIAVSDTATSAPEATRAKSSSDSSSSTVVVIVIIVAALVIVAGVGLMIRRRSRSGS